jgi:hypothetical protein
LSQDVRFIDCKLDPSMPGASLHRSTLDGVKGGDAFKGVVIGTDEGHE